MNGSQYLAHSSNVICHYGVSIDNGAPGRGSGRYPKGSGKRPFQSTGGVDINNQGMAIPLGLVVWAGMAALEVGTIATIGAIAKASDKAHEEKELKKKHAGQERDKKTGFFLKNKEYTDQEDINAVNPTLTKGDAKDMSYDAYNNCMLCSMYYELRKRGFDVEARVDSSLGRDTNVEKWFPGAKIETTPYKSSVGYYANINAADPESSKELKAYRSSALKMLESQPNGSRGALYVNWEKNGNIGGGHAVNYQIDKGKLKIIDCQIGKIYSGKQVSNEFLSQTCRVRMVRLDNLDYDPKSIKEVAK